MRFNLGEKGIKPQKLPPRVNFNNETPQADGGDGYDDAMSEDGDDQPEFIFPEPEGDHRVVDERNDVLCFDVMGDEHDVIVVRIPHGRYETARELAAAIENGNDFVGDCVAFADGRIGLSIVVYVSENDGRVGVNRKVPGWCHVVDCWEAAFLLGIRPTDHDDELDYYHYVRIEGEIEVYTFIATRPSPLPATFQTSKDSQIKMTDRAELDEIFGADTDAEEEETPQENFDEDMLHAIVKDDRFCKKDRMRLTEYNKNRRNGGEQLVSYVFGKEVANFKLGRLYPQHGIGLQAYRFDMRNPLAAKYYWDVDMENAHYCIAEMYCKQLGLEHTNITYYINHRDVCLKLVSDNRKKAKTEFLKVLYGGKLSLYKEDYEEIEGEVKQTGTDLLYRIQAEMEKLVDKLWKTNPEYHAIKTSKDGKLQALSKTHNGKYSLVSILFQTEERKMLMYFEYLMSINGRQMDVPIHDGGYVRKLQGETEFPAALLEYSSREMTAKFGCTIRMTQKPIAHEYVPPQGKKSRYEQLKEEFEQEYFYVGDSFLRMLGNGEFEFVKMRDLRDRMRNAKVDAEEDEDERPKKKQRAQYFLDRWMEDPERKRYERADFIPDREKCPDNVFNLFTGFEAEKIDPQSFLKDMTPEEAEAEEKLVVDTLRRHFYYITSGYEDHLLKWLSHIVQNPGRRTEMHVLLRDEGGFMSQGGGTGKNLILEFFGMRILGERYMYVVADNKELYGTFNSQFEGKLLVIIEEAKSKDNHENYDMLKVRATAKKQNVNRKGVAVYSVYDMSNTIFCSNNRNPLPVRQGDRRIQAFDADACMRDNVEYFTNLVGLLSKPSTAYYFFKYLKEYETYTSPIHFQTNIPKTPAYRQMRFLNAPKHFKWLATYIKEGKLKDGSMKAQMDSYATWAEEEGVRRDEACTSISAFGLLFAGKPDGDDFYRLDNVGEKRKSMGTMKMRWNIPALVEALKATFVLDDDFVYSGPKSDIDEDEIEDK
eukprot:gene25585-30896_t